MPPLASYREVCGRASRRVLEELLSEELHPSMYEKTAQALRGSVGADIGALDEVVRSMEPARVDPALKQQILAQAQDHVRKLQELQTALAGHLPAHSMGEPERVERICRDLRTAHAIVMSIADGTSEEWPWSGAVST